MRGSHTGGEEVQHRVVTTELDTLLTALHVHVDDRLKTPALARAASPANRRGTDHPGRGPGHAGLGFHCEARWLRFAHARLHGPFPCLPQRPAYNKRLRAALPLVKRAIRSLAADSDLWQDNLWIVDSPPVECARSHETVRRSDLAGWANSATAAPTPATAGA